MKGNLPTRKGGICGSKIARELTSTDARANRRHFLSGERGTPVKKMWRLLNSGGRIRGKGKEEEIQEIVREGAAVA